MLLGAFTLLWIGSPCPYRRFQLHRHQLGIPYCCDEQVLEILEVCRRCNFLSQVLSEPTRKDALLDLLFVNREGLVGDVMVGGCLGHSDHEMVEFKIFSVMRKKGQHSCHPGHQESKR